MTMIRKFPIKYIVSWILAALAITGCRAQQGVAEDPEVFIMKRVSETSEIATLGGGITRYDGTEFQISPNQEA